MHIEVVSIGDELLKGMIVNTNAAFISRALFENGYEVSRHSVFSDEPTILDKELRAALSRSSVIIATGGLGSTLDDHTRKIASILFNSEFAYNEMVAEDLKRRFGKDLETLNDQATCPSKATPLLNTVGTAPGLVFTESHKMLILLPGIPLEMQVMLTEKVIPLLQEHFPVQEKKRCVSLHCCLLTESKADPFLRKLQDRFPEVQVGIYPSYGEVTILLSSSHAEELRAFKEACEKQFATHLYTSPHHKLEEAIQNWFVRNGKTLSLAESCTGGMVASQIVSVAGASDYFLGSFVVYSDAWKQKLLGVSEQTLKEHGAVSEECAREMLAGVFRHSKADYAIAITGIAGPTGGSPEKPVGTVWAAIGQRGQEPAIGRFSLSGPRPKVIQASSRYVLGALFRKIAHGITPFSE
jgi:nicotinamide-nucleotide amidase